MRRLGMIDRYIAPMCRDVSFRLRSVLSDVRAGVGIIAALSVPAVIGSAGLAVDLNHGLEQRVINQRAADMAALGAAMAYKESSSVSVLDPTAEDIVRINGATGADVSASVIADFPNAGDQSVRVDVVTEVPYTLARVLGLTGSYEVTSQSFASLTAAVTKPPYAAPCMLALSSSNSAISVSGGGTISAADCTIAAVGGINNNGSLIQGHDIVAGTGNITNSWGTLTAETLRYGGSFSNPAWNNNVPAANKRVNETTVLVDPWAGSTVLSDARALLGTPAGNPSALSNPDTASCGTATNYSFDWNPGNGHPAKAYWQDMPGGKKGYAMPTGTYCIGKVTVGGDLSVTFGHGSKIYIRNGFSNGGYSFNFGNSDVYVNGGFDSGSSGVTFGDGVLHIGSGTVKFAGTNHKGNGKVTINATLSMGGGQSLYMGNGDHFFGAVDLGGGGFATMGTGNFIAVNGVKVNGGSELSIGNGNVELGANASTGRSIDLDGSGIFLMGDGTFRAKGHINTLGGSKLAFGKTANHFINGNMTIGGAVLFGAGRYTINGNFTNGTGGTTWPYTDKKGRVYGNTLEGVSVSGFDQAGVDVTFVLAGTLNLSGGAKTKLLASETTVDGAQIADMLLYSNTANATTWTAGANNRFGGVVYLPNSAVTMSGGNSTLDSGRCFSLIASTISVTGGAATGSVCATVEEAYNGGGGESSSGAIRLVR